MRLQNFMFRSRNEKQLAGLQGKVQIMLHGGRRSPLDFYCLGKNLESYRDLLADYLDGLPLGERGPAEDSLWPAVKALCDKVDKLVDQAREAGLIDEGLAYDIGMMGISLMFVTSFTKHVF